MGNILGEGFLPEIIKQIDVRQKVYGSGYANASRTPNELIYLNANSSWCKLVSSADITNSNILNNKGIAGLGSDLLSNNNLAKEFILFNGTSYQTDKVLSNGKTYPVSEMRGGIDFTNSLTGNRRAYGMGGNEFGIKPMPGIISATIKHKNRGSIRAATVNIKAWNKVQFEIIDILYLRLGFSVLLEWGNAMYFNNKEELKTGSDINNSLADDFLKGGVSYLDFLSYIQQRRKRSQGNYDAMFAKVTNFHWSFQPDGSYDITLDLISAGDIVESFKINRTDTNATIIDPSSTQPEEDLDPSSETSSVNKVLAKYSTTSNIANFLFKSSALFYSKGITSKGIDESVINFGDGQSLFLYNINAKTNFSPDRPDYLSPNKAHNESITESIKTKDIVLVSPPDINRSKISYFIRLGCLLKYIEEGVMYQVKQKNNNTPLLKFDYDVETNLMHAPPQLMSYDPFICMVTRNVGFPGISSPTIEARTYFSDQKTAEREEFGYSSDIGDPFQSSKNPQWGKIMNIYVNFKYILTKLNELRNAEDNSIALVDFLQNILSGINGAFGGYSKLDIFIDEETNSVKIIDKNPLPDSKSAFSIPQEYALFELYGYSSKKGEKESRAGFIKDFKFTTELTPQLSTMITVSATSQGNVVGENNTALSKLNLGLRDRFKEEINDTTANTLLSPKDRLEQARKNFSEFVKFQLRPFLNHLYKNIYIQSEADSNKQAAKTYFDLYNEYIYTLDLYSGRNVEKLSTSFQPGTGFIPFNLSLTMDGLSGMKIGSKFLIDASYLPSNYPQTVDFLIKNIQHEIKDNKWTTTLESYCIAQGSEVTNIPERTSTSTAPTFSTIPTNPLPAPDWSKYNVGATPLLKQAVTDQSTYVYSKGIYAPNKGLVISGRTGEVTGSCGKYTYAIAYKLKDYINSNSSKAITFTYVGSGGDTYEDAHRIGINNLGIYDMYYLGDYKASELKGGFIDKFKWNYGDILNYYSPGNSPTSNMHSQIYTGDIWKTGINPQGVANKANNSGWSTSGATNYGQKFVYSSTDLVFKVYAFKVKPEYLK